MDNQMMWPSSPAIRSWCRRKGLMRNSLTFTRKIAISTAGLLFLAGVGFAQDPQSPPEQEKPKPAAKVYGPIGSEDQDQNQTPAETLQPDERPLTGFHLPTVGTPTERHSYWVPGVSYYNFIQSNGSSQGGGNGWNSTNYLSGNVSLLQNWSRSQLTLNYSGGGNFSTDSVIGNGWNSTNYLSGNVSLLQNWSRSQLTLNYSGGGNFSTDSVIGNGWFQQFDATQTFNWQRWQL